jgi:CHAT domain-containing protein
MKMNGAFRTPSLVLAALAAVVWAEIALAAPDDVALAQQKAAIQAMDNARQEYLKTWDMVRYRARLEQPERDLAAGLGEFNRTRNSAAAGVSLQKLGEIYRLQEKYPAAFVYFLTAIAEAETAGDEKTHALALIGEGRCELTMTKDYKSAGDHFQEAAELAARLEDPDPYFNALSWEAQPKIMTGDLVGGVDLLARAFELGPRLRDRSLLLFAHLDRADLFQTLAEKSGASKAYDAQLQSLDVAKDDYEAALKLAREFGYAGLSAQIEGFLRRLTIRQQMVGTNVSLGKTLAKSGAFAPKKPSDVLANEEFVPGVVDLPSGLIGLLQQGGMLAGGAREFVTRGIFAATQGDADAALADYLKAADALEADRRNLRDDESRAGFFNDKIAFYYPAISQLLQRKRYAEAFALMERSRSRAMADLIFSKKLALSRPNEQVLFGEAQRLRAEIAAQQKKLFADRTRPDREAVADKIRASEEKIAQLEKADRDLSAKMAKEAPHLRQLTVSEPASLERVQQMLREDGSEMLYYLALEDSVILWHIGGDSQQVRSVFLPRSELKTKVAALRTSVESRDPKFDEKSARELFLFLIQPALGWIKTSHLIVVPHAEMNYLPFAALVAPSGKSLGEMFALSDAPNAGLLLDLKKGEAVSKGRLFAAADPGIEAARGEVEAVAAFYPERNKTVVDPLVAESEVKASAGQYDVLHLSVHGKFTPLEPMLSYLQLGKDARDDGRLTAAEMFGLSLGKTHLVVLSACETGQTEATPGNEVLGMERALLYAGANNLVLSQWPVDAASTALWMKTFHREAQTKPLAEAARLALIETKKKYPQPYYWAAFRLVGR